MILSFIKKHKYQFLLVTLILVALYPLSLFIYIPKWDNINGYLAYRYFIGDYVWNGHLPLWNSFQRLGYPGYADLQSGAWSPIVWLLLLFGKYTINSLIIELLSCYVFAGLGFYKLSQYFFKNDKIAFVLGLSYALSGFMIGSSQLMVFLIAVTWFPWIIYYLLRFFQSYQLRHQLLVAFFMALFITGASPAYTIILAYIVLGMFIYQLFVQKRVKQIALGGLIILVTLLVLTAPYLNAFFEFAPYFNRVDKLEFNAFLLSNPFTPISYSSFIFPYGVLAKTDWFNMTDLSLRNGYFGIVSCLFLIASFFSAWNRTKISLVLATLLSLLLAAGGETVFYTFFYQLPGFGVFRHPSMFRAFTIFCVLLLSGFELKHALENGIERRHRFVFISLLGVFGIVMIWAFLKTDLKALGGLMGDVFNFVEFSSASLSTHILLNSIVLLILGALFFVLTKAIKLPWLTSLIVVVILDLTIQTRLSLPTTICYKIPHQSVSDFFHELPNEINQEDNYKPMKTLDETQPLHQTDGIWQNLSTYNKTLSSIGINPLRFKRFDDAKANGQLEKEKEFNVMYFPDSKESANQIKIDYNRFEAEILAHPQIRTLVLNQNYHHLWHAYLEGAELPIKLHHELTMAVEIPAHATGKLVFEYQSPRTLPAFILSLLGYLTLIIVLVFSKKQMHE